MERDYTCCIALVGKEWFEFRRPFLCKKEVCLNKIRSSGPPVGFTNTSEKLKISSVFQPRFSNIWPLGDDDISWPDELDPDIITDYIISLKKLTSPREQIYPWICKLMSESINYFYQGLDQFLKDGRAGYTGMGQKYGSSAYLYNDEVWLEHYRKLLMEKAQEDHPLIRIPKKNK